LPTPTGGGGFETRGFNTEVIEWPDYTRPQTLNGWAYGEGNPINGVDPTGRWTCYTGSPLAANPSCREWVTNGLTKLEQGGPVGKKVVEFFYQHDTAVKWSAIGGCAILPLAENVWGIKFGFVANLPANGMAVWPDKILLNSLMPGFQGPTPTYGDAVVTLGHEISHLSQGPTALSVQGEVLSTIVGYYLENEQAVAHRDDAEFIFRHNLNPWSELDLQTYNEGLAKLNYGKLPWPLMSLGGTSKDWLVRFNITLTYLSPRYHHPGR
jgi:hypothetical protein